MQISLVITTYNRPDALLVVLKSVERQSQIPYEVIIADDGSNNKTKKIISSFSVQSKLKIIHSFQNDKGFRAAKSRNKAISKASGEYIVLIDGDMILHKNFIYDHAKASQLGYFVQGTRVLLNQNRTKQTIKNETFYFHFFGKGLKNRKNAIYSNFLSSIFTNNKNFIRGIKTCNVAFYKKDCISVNGFNSEFEGWGREDTEFFIRLMNKGINRKTLRFNAIQYHLWHNELSRDALINNDLLLEKTINNNLKWCNVGIDQFL
jgi:glycosyltransferase involved in cell wall biosynthesis